MSALPPLNIFSILPGGHTEFGETFAETARRELAEETGLTDITIKGIISLFNEREYGKHYVCIGVLASWNSGEPIALEPTKSKNWTWTDPTKLPDPMFVASKKCITNWLAGTLYSDEP